MTLTQIKTRLGPMYFILKETVLLLPQLFVGQSTSLREERAKELASYTVRYLSRLLDTFYTKRLNSMVGMQGIKKILVIRPDKIGDVVWTSPVLSTLRRRFPRATVYLVVSSQTVPIVANNPHVDKIITYDVWTYATSKRKNTPLAHRLKILCGLLNEDIDIALNLKPTLGFLLFGLLNKKPFVSCGSGGHEVENALSPLYTLGINDPDRDLSLFLSEEDNVFAEEFLAAKGITSGDRMVAIHPGAGYMGRRWMPRKFAMVADAIVRTYGARVLLLGAPGDVDRVVEIAREMHSRPIIAAGKTSLMQMAALLKRCSLFIGQDSGPTHIAAALRVPIVVIWGPVGLNLAHPWTDDSLYRVVRNPVSCWPCGMVKCRMSSEYECIQGTSPAEVVRAASLYLGGDRAEYIAKWCPGGRDGACRYPDRGDGRNEKSPEGIS